MSFRKTNRISILTLTSILCLQSVCNKNFDCRGTVYSFGISVKAYPDRDSIKMGDTVWLQVYEPTTLTDIQTGRVIDYQGAINLGSAIAFQAFTSTTGQFTVDAVENFDFFLTQGVESSIRTPTLYKNYLFSESNGSYVFKLALIAKQKGIYRLIFSNASGVIRKNDKCTKAAFGINFKNTNQHYYLNPNFTGGPTPVGGDYYFKVF